MRPRRLAAALTAAAIVLGGGVAAAAVPAVPAAADDVDVPGAFATAAAKAHAAATAHPAHAAHPAKSAPRSAVQRWARHHYGTFRTVTVHGTGTARIPLPKHLRAAIVSASTRSRHNVVLETLDARGGALDLLVNAIGAYRGSTAFGLDRVSAARTLAVSADGSWTVRIRPVDTAGTLPKRHTGDGVFLLDRPAAVRHVTGSGTANLIVEQHQGGTAGEHLLVNAIGRYAGDVAFDGGPSVVDVRADGRWTSARR